MFLKAPSILIFAVSIILAAVILYARYVGTYVSFLTGDPIQFYGLLVAYLVLVLGCIMRGL
jgi:hypothetical protein